MRSWILLLCVLLWGTGCNKTPEEQLNTSIQSYLQEKTPANRKKILKKICAYAALLSYSDRHAILSDTYLVKNGDKEAEKNIYFFDGHTITLPEAYTFLSYNEKNHHIAASDGYTLRLYNEQNQIAQTVELTPGKKTGIDALVLTDANLYYFYKRNVYSLDLSTLQETVLWGKETFSPPYTRGSFTVHMLIQDDYCALTVGNAGLYHLSIYDLSKGEQITKNTKTASSRLLLIDNACYYVAGTTGKWQIHKFDLNKQHTQKIYTLPAIKDIMFTSSNIIYTENRDTTVWDRLSTETYHLPSELKPVRTLATKSVLVRYEDSYYLLQPCLFFNKLEEIYQKDPDFAAMPTPAAE